MSFDKSIWLMGILVIFTTSCGKLVDNCLKTTGKITEEIRLIPAFKNLEIRDNVNVYWHRSDSGFVKLKAGKNLLEKINTSVEGQTLEVQNKNSCNWTRSYENQVEVHLYSPAPYVVRMDGFGQFKSDDTLTASPLTIQHYGAGDIELNIRAYEVYVDFNSVGNCAISGWAKSGAYNIQNVGKLKANQLEMKQCEIYMDGENDAWIWASEKIKGEHLSNRTLFLKGKPDRQINFKGKGRIIEIQ